MLNGWLERSTVNAEVGGSSPPGVAFLFFSRNSLQHTAAPSFLVSPSYQPLRTAAHDTARRSPPLSSQPQPATTDPRSDMRTIARLNTEEKCYFGSSAWLVELLCACSVAGCDAAGLSWPKGLRIGEAFESDRLLLLCDDDRVGNGLAWPALLCSRSSGLSSALSSCGSIAAVEPKCADRARFPSTNRLHLRSSELLSLHHRRSTTALRRSHSAGCLALPRRTRPEVLLPLIRAYRSSISRLGPDQYDSLLDDANECEEGDRRYDRFNVIVDDELDITDVPPKLRLVAARCGEHNRVQRSDRGRWHLAGRSRNESILRRCGYRRGKVVARSIASIRWCSNGGQRGNDYAAAVRRGWLADGWKLLGAMHAVPQLAVDLVRHKDERDTAKDGAHRNGSRVGLRHGSERKSVDPS
ncbi:hypothetical protein L1887_57741 [Cichorium endivia]|nr:hypothetical protein L1887_57741 [Cichorium endivia]